MVGDGASRFNAAEDEPSRCAAALTADERALNTFPHDGQVNGCEPRMDWVRALFSVA
jgi:hypothetical protein